MVSNYSSRLLSFNVVRIGLAVILGLLLGALAVRAGPLPALGALAVLLLVILLLRRPEMAIVGYLILTSTFFNATANPGIGLPFGHIYVTDILLVLMLAMIALRAFVEPGFHLVHTPLDLPLWIFVGMAYLSTALALTYSGMLIQQSLGEMRVVAGYLLFFAVTNLVRDRRQLKFLILAVLVLACLVGVAMVVQYIRGPSTPILAGRVETLYTEGRGYADIFRVIPPGDSIVLVGFLVVCAALWVEDAEVETFPGLLAAILTGLGVLLTFKRHYWVGVLVALALLALLYRRKSYQHVFLTGLIGSLGLIAALIFVMNFTGSSGPRLVSASIGRLVSLTNSQTYSSPSSSLRWRDFENYYALPQIAAHPFLGIGLGAKYRPLVPPKDWSQFDGRAFIHNAHIWILTKTGLLGYLPFITFLILGLFRGFRHWRSVPDGRLRALVLGITLAFVGMLIGSWVEPTLMEATWTPVIGAMLGVNELILSGALLAAPKDLAPEAIAVDGSGPGTRHRAADVGTQG